jgi:phosphoribosylaminoimidazole carboxylase (NCAIR synthetase)
MQTVQLMFFLDLTAPRCDCVDVACSELAKLCDILTMEIEHVNCDILEELEKEGKSVEPSSRTVRTIQDKFLQKQHMTEVRATNDYNYRLHTFNNAETILAVIN